MLTLLGGAFVIFLIWANIRYWVYIRPNMSVGDIEEEERDLSAW